MSRNELCSGNRMHSLDFQLVVNTGFIAVPAPSFFLGVSQIFCLELVTAVGVGAGTAVVTDIAVANSGAVGAHGVTITVASTVNTDGSLYRLWWVNNVSPNSAISYSQ